MNKEEVILVDEHDVVTGTMEKIEAHRGGLLHRAISVFIIDSQGRWLLQRRARNKYHSNSLWTNTCCSHPLPSENNREAADRRLFEEMGLHCELTELFHFIYREDLDNELTEHELDHVFFGITNMAPKINHEEVMEFKYIDYKDLVDDVAANPGNYTVWFRLIMARVDKSIKDLNLLK
jgi:isopentenyl-diphosphate Delta-isomerase